MKLMSVIGPSSRMSNGYNKTSSINLSKLNTYKGKFSLTNKYNSLLHNNKSSQYNSIGQ
jgi:hypothetical protein